MKPQIQFISGLFSVLGHEKRLEICLKVMTFGEKGVPVGHIQKSLEIAPSTLSHHLQKLCGVGLIIQERIGTTLICRCDLALFQKVEQFLKENCCQNLGDQL